MDDRSIGPRRSRSKVFSSKDSRQVDERHFDCCYLLQRKVSVSHTPQRTDPAQTQRTSSTYSLCGHGEQETRRKRTKERSIERNRCWSSPNGMASSAKEIELKTVEVEIPESNKNDQVVDELFYREPEKVLRNVKTVPLKHHRVLSVSDVENTVASREVAFSKLKLNFSFIFDEWDAENNGFLDVREIQLGLCKIGMFVSRDDMLKAAKRIGSNLHTSHRILARDFATFVGELAGNNMNDLSRIVNLLKSGIPMKDSDRPTAWIPVPSKTPKRKSRTKSTADRLRRVAAAGDDVENVRLGMIWYHPKIIFETLTFQRGILPAIVMFLCWQFGFSLFYCLYNEFRFDRAYYYSAQAGLSVGFGALSEEYKGGMLKPDPENDCKLKNPYDEGHFDVSKFVTIINVLLGSSVIGGALGYFIDSALEKQGNWYDKMDTHDVQSPQQQQKSRSTKLSSTWSVNALVLFYESNRTESLLVAAVFVFLVAGVTFGMVHEEWTFVTSLYFSVAAMSTAGLQAPNPESATSMLFTGTYVLIGVPLYGCCLGTFANMLVKKAQDRREAEELEASISKEEFHYMNLIKTHGHDTSKANRKQMMSESLNKHDFFQMELLRTGIVDLDFLNEVDEMFDKFDVDGSGDVSWIEMVAFSAFQSVDEDESGSVDFEEFTALMRNMSMMHVTLFESFDVGDPSFVRKIFDACNQTDDEDNDSTMITRREFCNFVTAVSLGREELDRFLKTPKLYDGSSSRRRRKSSFVRTPRA